MRFSAVEMEVAAPVLPVDDISSLEELLAKAEALIVEPLPPLTAVLAAQAASIAAPVAIARVEVKVAAKPLAKMNSKELRKKCTPTIDHRARWPCNRGCAASSRR